MVRRFRVSNKLDETHTIGIERRSECPTCFPLWTCNTISIFLQSLLLFKLFFQLWYEATQEIQPNEELLLPPKVPLFFRDMYSDGFEDRSDRETGKSSHYITYFTHKKK